MEITSGTKRRIIESYIIDSALTITDTKPDEISPDEPNIKDNPIENPSFLSLSGLTSFYDIRVRDWQSRSKEALPLLTRLLLQSIHQYQKPA